MAAVGAKRWQIPAFIRAEALLIFVGGSFLAGIIGTVVAWMLVKLLTGVFDPAPDHMTVPWVYQGILFSAAAASTGLAVRITE